MTQPTITATHTGAVILRTTLPDGTEREITISERDGWSTLLGVLHRLTNQAPLTTQQQANRATAQANINWTPGQEVRFAPPQHSPWRDGIIWPSANPDFITVIVRGERKDGLVKVQASAPVSDRIFTIAVPSKHLQHPTRQFDHRGKRKLTLEDLGL